MSLLKHIFSTKALIRSLKISTGLAAAYLVISAALIFWPSSAPFADTATNADGPQSNKTATSSELSSVDTRTEISFEARDGERLFAQQLEAEAATTILLLHGIAPNKSAMNTAAKWLHEATGAEVITPDFRGHGQSGGDPFDVDYIGQFEDDLEDMIHFIQRERPENRILVAGHSMGGGVAMRYALKENAPTPDAYLLIAPNFGEGPTQRSGDDVDESQAEEVAEIVHFNVRRMIGILMLNTVGIHALDPLPIMFFNNPHQRIEYSFRAILSAQPIRPKTSDIALQAVKSPLLVIIGSDDEVFEVKNFESFVSENSDGKTVVVPGLNHETILTNPAGFEFVKDWYRSLS